MVYNQVYLLSDCVSPGDPDFRSHTFAAPKRAHAVSREALPIMAWHRRLCHLNQADLLRLAADPTSCVAIQGSKQLPFCEVRVQATQTRRYSKTPRSRLTQPLARVHIDLAGGSKTLDPNVSDDEPLPSRLGAKNVLIITDDATRYRCEGLGLGDRLLLALVTLWVINLRSVLLLFLFRVWSVCFFVKDPDVSSANLLRFRWLGPYRVQETKEMEHILFENSTELLSAVRWQVIFSRASIFEGGTRLLYDPNTDAAVDQDEDEDTDGFDVRNEVFREENEENEVRTVGREDENGEGAFVRDGWDVAVVIPGQG